MDGGDFRDGAPRVREGVESVPDVFARDVAEVADTESLRRRAGVQAADEQHAECFHGVEKRRPRRVGVEADGRAVGPPRAVSDQKLDAQLFEARVQHQGQFFVTFDARVESLGEHQTQAFGES